MTRGIVIVYVKIKYRCDNENKYFNLKISRITDNHRLKFALQN